MSAIPSPPSDIPIQLLSPDLAEEMMLAEEIHQEATPVLLAQQQFDQDVLGDINEGFSNFIESGQVWALLIGLILGYFIRGLTR